MDRDFMIICLLVKGYSESYLSALSYEELYSLVHDECFPEIGAVNEEKL